MSLVLEIGIALPKNTGGTIPASPILFNYNWTAATLGPMTNTAFVAAYPKLTFARASVATVQTAAATVDSTPLTNYPRIGSQGASWGRGLVIEESRKNVVLNCRDTTGSGWNAPLLGALTTPNYATSPDGTNNGTRFIDIAGSVSNYQTINTTTLGANGMVMSLWVRGTSAAATNTMRHAGTIDVNDSITTAGTGWERHVFAFANASPGGGTNIFPEDMRIIAGATDIVVDFYQLEGGKFATEAIVSGASATTRAGDQLTIGTGSDAISSGQLSIALTFVGKAIPNKYLATAYLWYVDANNNCSIDTSQKVNVKIAGTTVTSGSAIVWVAGDIVDIFIRAGGGTNALVEYRKNGGSVTTLVNTSLAGNLSPTTIDILNAAAASQLSVWLQGITCYTKGNAPGWVV